MNGQPIKSRVWQKLWMISKCGWEMRKAMCVRFLFREATCSVTERISFFCSSAAIIRKVVLEFVWIFFLVGPFSRHVSIGMWGCDCWLFGQFGEPFSRELHACVFFRFDNICDFAHQRHVRYQLWCCIAVRRRRFSRAPHVSTDFESQADQSTTGEHPQLP